MMQRLLNAILFLLIFSFSSLYAAPEALLTYRYLYEDSLNKLTKDYDEKVSALEDMYVERLERLKSTYEHAGDVDGKTQVEAEQEAVTASTVLPDLPADLYGELVLVRGQYQRALQIIDEEHLEKVTQLRSKFITHMQNYETKLTQENKIEDALAVREEVNRLSSEQVVAEPVERLEPVPVDEQFRLIWGMPHRTSQVYVFTGDIQTKPELTMTKGVVLQREFLEFNGGRAVVAEGGDGLWEAVKQTGQLTLMIDLEVDSLDQTRYARIIGYSKNRRERDFSLCQQMDELIMRLRTSKTHSNGTNPVLNLGKLKAGERTRLVFSYSEKGPICYRDGVKVDVRSLKGDFSTWEKMTLLLGNEVKDEHPWMGKVYRFALSNEALSEDAAQKASMR
ncbi:hypothetical protein P3T73_09560 [Kiritimatiellota bacterium B12222]|nr:hypothetical protein P3T73_09560 [Kiritimatiellota bacterium B12222]